MSLSSPLRRVVACLCVVGFAGGVAGAAEAVAENAVDADAARLLDRLPRVAELTASGGKVVWRGSGGEATVVGVDGDGMDPLLDSAIGPVRVAHDLVENHRTGVLAALGGLAASAKAAGVAAKDVELVDDALTGPALRSDAVVVLVGGVLKKQAPPPGDRSAEVARLHAAVLALIAQDGATGLDDIGRSSLDAVLKKLDQPDGHEAVDEIAPSLARRQVRHGWLRHWYRDGAAAAAAAEVEGAVAAAARPQAAGDGYASDTVRLGRYVDAFGSGGMVFTTPQKVAISHDEPRPEMLGEDTGLTVVIDLPPGTDPAAGAAKAVAARSLHDGVVVASWSATAGFTADRRAWAAAEAFRGEDLLPHAIPPHILLSGLDGDVAALAVPGGLLRPAQDAPVASTAGPKDGATDGNHADSDRFLTDAAHLLPDAAQLDLVGEYLFAYVYPSPDSAHPELMGNKQLKSNVQQTVWQTCGNAAGGIMHGDCADIAELYQTITLRQGIDPVVIGLPEHAACAWADQVHDGWRVQVLQTGPPLAFTDAELPGCLEKTFKSFDPGMTFDANQVPLLLRFSGEVSRSDWALSWRIFKDRDYFTVMTDVQRDWHYETYQRGVATMKGLIAAGDDDNANYRELSGLFSFTGQYDLCAEYHRKAMDRTADPVSKLYMSVELVGHLLDAGKADQAKAVADDVLDQQLPALKDQLDAAYFQVGLDLVSTALAMDNGPGLPETAERAMGEVAAPTLGDMTNWLANWVKQNYAHKKDAWDNNTELHSMRGLVAAYAGVVTEMTARRQRAHQPPDALGQAMQASVERWLAVVAFRDVENDSEVMQRYAAAGRWYEAQLGTEAFDRMLDGVAVPTAAIPLDEHQQRQAGDAQVQRDLPWIRASVPYWYGRLSELFRRDRTTIDRAQVARITARIAEARSAGAALGMADPIYEGQALLGAEVAALIARDDAGLRAALAAVAKRNDKQFRDDAAQWLGDAARFIPPQEYAAVLKAWQDTNDYKPKYFWIAWRAALNHAPEQALMAAKLAAERFSDDPAFAEEYGYMKQVLAAQATAQAAGATASAAAPTGAMPP